VYDTAVLLGRSVLHSLRIRRTVIGARNIPETGGAVIAMTHFGYMEFALVEWAVVLHNRRRIRFMATQGAFERPVIGALLRGARQIPVDMTAGHAAFDLAVTALREGELVGVFPEAGVDASFTVRELKTGAARLAARAGVPIIPVAVWGGQRLMTKGHRVGFFERFSKPVYYWFGEPMYVSTPEDAAGATVILRDTLQTLIARLQAQYPDDGSGQWWQPAHLGGTAPTPEQAVAAETVRTAKRAAARAAKSARKSGRKS
jgi:1-acyl-sn-glycerol-3-phosphate acyltransferase